MYCCLTTYRLLSWQYFWNKKNFQKTKVVRNYIIQDLYTVCATVEHNLKIVCSSLPHFHPCAYKLYFNKHYTKVRRKENWFLKTVPFRGHTDTPTPKSIFSVFLLILHTLWTVSFALSCTVFFHLQYVPSLASVNVLLTDFIILKLHLWKLLQCILCASPEKRSAEIKHKSRLPITGFWAKISRL